MAVPWYENESDYLAVVAMLPASERQDPLTYRAFRAKIEAFEKDLQNKGMVTRRIPIKAVTVKTWCDAHNKQVCRQSLTDYITADLAFRLRDETRNN